MKQKRLIAVDLDGTLFNAEHRISDRTLETMHVLIERGHTMLVITGRSSHSALPRLTDIPDSVRLICSNGAYEYNRQSQAIEWAHFLSAQQVTYIRQQVADAMPSASFGWESAAGLNYEEQFLVEAGGAHTLEQGGGRESIGQRDALKLFVRAPEQNGAAVAAVVRELLEKNVEVSSSGAPFAEITAAGVNKGRALEKIATELGFSTRQTMAFGDNDNDTSMLQWAGESVAMANALEPVKAIASAITLSNSEDGVADYLEKNLIGSA